MRLFTLAIFAILSYGLYAESSVIKINRDDTYIVDESGDVTDMYPLIDMNYVVRERLTDEQSKFLDENGSAPIKTWYNLKQVHVVEVIQAGFSYYVKIYFSPYEWYYLESFDCEKAAVRYAHDVMKY